MSKMANEKLSKDEDFKSFIQKNMKTVAEGIKRSQTLPIGSTRTNFLSCYPNFKDEVEPFSKKLLSMMSMLLKKENVKIDVKNCDSEEKIDLMVDGINKILDRVKDNLNELNGLRKNPIVPETNKLSENISGSWSRKSISTRQEGKLPNKFVKPLHIQKVLEKPQSKFEVKIDNSNTPFQPRLTSKPNAKKPLNVYLETNLRGIDHYCHPYMHELNRFKLPAELLETVKPIWPVEIESENVKYIDNVKDLNEMAESLKEVKELAVDLEGHQFRSYQGLTCLMQISTRKMDYIVDTLALRPQLHVLNEVFTDPEVVKVFHGAGNDVLWLQKDFDLYVVNMFDTHIASLVLDFPKLSLAYLLKEYCDVDTDKRYQLYDWRIRPLPQAALTYARSDTHYLLYVYDRLRNDLLERGNGSTRLLESVFSRSVEVCKRKYEKMTSEDDYLTLYKQSKQNFDNRQLHALKSLYSWRDKIAREEDESTGYVLPNHMLLQIAEILPREMQGILACCNPIPALVRKNLSHLHQLICIARSQPVTKTAIQTDGHALATNKAPVLSKLRCPHDFSHLDDFRDNLATVLDGLDVIQPHEKSTTKPYLTVFGDDDEKEENDEYQIKINKFKAIKFMSPYERYRKTVLFAEATTNKLNALKSSHDMKQGEIAVSHEFRLPEKMEEGNKVDVNRSVDDKIKQASTNVIQEPVQNEKTNTDTEKRIKRKFESDVEELPNKKLAKDYDAVASSVKMTELVESENEKEDTETKFEAPVSKARKTNNEPRRKKKRKCKSEEGVNGNRSFTPIDYAKANFNKFLTSGPKNLKKLLNSKISFGTDKKNKNKKNQTKRGRR